MANQCGSSEAITGGGGKSCQIIPRHDPIFEELCEESTRWVALVAVARCFGKRVVVREFWLRAGLQGKILAYRLEKGFYLFRYLETSKRDMVLNLPWVVN